MRSSNIERLPIPALASTMNQLRCDSLWMGVASDPVQKAVPTAVHILVQGKQVVGVRRTYRGEMFDCCCELVGLLQEGQKRSDRRVRKLCEADFPEQIIMSPQARSIDFGYRLIPATVSCDSACLSCIPLEQGRRLNGVGNVVSDIVESIRCPLPRLQPPCRVDCTRAQERLDERCPSFHTFRAEPLKREQRQPRQHQRGHIQARADHPIPALRHARNTAQLRVAVQ